MDPTKRVFPPVASRPSPEIAGKIRSVVTSLCSLLDVPGSKDEYVEELLGNIDTKEIPLLRATQVKNKLAQRVPASAATLKAHMAAFQNPVFDRFLVLVCTIVEDKQITAMMSKPNARSTLSAEALKARAKPTPTTPISVSTPMSVTTPMPATTPISGAKPRVPPAPAPRGTTKILQRPSEDQDLMDLTYGSTIILRVKDGGFCVLDPKGKFLTQSLDAIPFTILNAKHPRDRGPCRFQDSICLCNPQGLYLSDQSGAITGLRYSGEDSASLKWTIQSHIDSGALGVVKIFDNVGLRSDFGTQLSHSKEGSANEGLGPEQVFRLSRSNLPYVPDWIRSRAQALDDDAKREEKLTGDGGGEQALLEDLLSALLGIQSRTLILIDDQFRVHPQIFNPALVNVLQKILPVCDYYRKLTHYVAVHSRFEFGYVSHALAAAVRATMKDYTLLVAQLEHLYRQGSLTLLRAWYYVQPCLRTLEWLHQLTSQAAHVTGGALLNVLYAALKNQGDERTRSICIQLLTRASAPYLQMLEDWIYGGVVHDPYEEFQIKSRDDLTKENVRKDFNDTYWDERYSVRPNKLPVFFDEALSQKILMTGKYLNVIRECGKSISCPSQTKIRFTLDDHEYEEPIDKAYSFASRELLNMLWVDQNLMGRLNSIKRYFLLNQGDFFDHFMDIAAEELDKPVTATSSPKLESLLELALRTSGARHDPYKDDLGCYLQTLTLMQKLEAIHQTAEILSGQRLDTNVEPQLKRLEGFTLNYRVRWPLSLIISKKTLTKYQLIFRHLFYCKHVERQISSTWLNHQSTKELNLRSAFMASYALCHRMLMFMQSLSYYMMVEVLEPNWHQLEAHLNQVNTVDQVLKYHNEFLDKCLKECLLTNQTLLKLLTKIMSTCLMFAQNIDRFTSSVKVDEKDDDELSGKAGEVSAKRKDKLHMERIRVHKIVGNRNYVNMIEKFVAHFDGKLKQFAKEIRDKTAASYDHHLSNLYSRLDFNDYYSGYFESDGKDELV